MRARTRGLVKDVGRIQTGPMNETPFSPPLPDELWQQIPPVVQDALRLVFAQYDARLAAAEARIKQLELQLGLTSKNSHKPPSSDPPSTKPTTPSHPRKPRRKRGGQPGHKGHSRKLLPVSEVSHTVILKPSACRHCGYSFEGLQHPNPERHQVVELPVVKPFVTEYQRHHLDCPSCHKRTEEPLPAGVPKGMCGPRLTAMVGICTGDYLLPKRTTERLLGDLVGIDLSLGGISRTEQVVSRALCEPVEELKSALRTQSRVHIDETGMKQRKQRGWLWVFATLTFSVFVLSLSRAGSVVKELLGSEFAGDVYSDRFSAYHWILGERRQFCWAHLKRDFEQFKLRGGRSAVLGERLLLHTRHLFGWVHEVRAGTLSRKLFSFRVKRLQSKVERVLREGERCQPKKGGEKECDCAVRGRECVSAKTASVCRSLLKRKESLWVFLEREHLELTNNAAERALRPAVLYRKRSFGVDSERGARFLERIMTTVGTLRLQKRPVLEFITQAVEAYFRGEAPPSLLPLPPSLPPDSP